MRRCGQLDGERRRVADPAGALGGDLPDVERGLHELVLADGALGGGADARARCARETARSKRPLLAMMTRSVRSRSTGLAGLWKVPHAQEPQAPRALAPDDLAAQQQAEAVLEDGDDVGRERAVRLAAEVGHVDRDAPARLELVDALGEDVVEHLEVVDVAGRDVADPQLQLVLLAGEVGRRGDDQGDGVVQALVAFISRASTQ